MFKRLIIAGNVSIAILVAASGSAFAAGCSDADAERAVTSAQRQLGAQPSTPSASANWTLRYMMVSRQATVNFRDRCGRSDLNQAVTYWDTQITNLKTWMRQAGISIKN